MPLLPRGGHACLGKLAVKPASTVCSNAGHLPSADPWRPASTTTVLSVTLSAAVLPAGADHALPRADVACRLRRKLHGRDVAVHALYNFVASFGGPKGASSQRAWSRVADMLSPGASHKVRALSQRGHVPPPISSSAQLAGLRICPCERWRDREMLMSAGLRCVRIDVAALAKQCIVKQLCVAFAVTRSK